MHSNSLAVIDRNGNQDSLRFPAFHSEILRQQTWDSRDLYGRIRVIISEGYYRPLRSPPFQRVKDILALSFQHAPRGKDCFCLFVGLAGLILTAGHRYPGGRQRRVP